MKTRHQMMWLNSLIVLIRGSQYPTRIDIEHFEMGTPPTYVYVYVCASVKIGNLHFIIDNSIKRIIFILIIETTRIPKNT